MIKQGHIITHRFTDHCKRKEEKEKEMGYVLINERGTLLARANAPILEVHEGERISYRTDRLIASERDIKGDMKRFHYRSCEAKVEKYVLETQSPATHYSIKVVGSNPLDVEKVIRKIERFLGVEDISLGKLELPSCLPEFRSIFERLRFLCWGYIIHGQVAYHSELSQEEIDRQSNEAWEDYKKEEAEKEKKEIDEAYTKDKEEKKKEREKEEEERNREDEEDFQDDESREVNLGDSPGSFKICE